MAITICGNVNPVAGSVATGNGTTLNFTAAGTAGQVLQSNGASAPTWTSSIAATAGGTGQTSYAVGDVLYASTTTALSKLPDVATGNALISGGVGVAPSYGKIGLTTHVSGTLPVANGGTGTTNPAIVAGTNITVTGTWPNQTINSTGGGGTVCATPTVAGKVLGRTCNSVLRTALGANAGLTTQGGSAVAIGACAGLTTQGSVAVAIGRSSGATSQGSNAVAIGRCSGYANQGTNAIAIGNSAGYTNQPSCSIAIGVNVNATGVNQTHIGPIRYACCVSGYQSLFYCGTTKEIVQATGGGGGSCATPTVAGIVFGETSIGLQSTSLGYQAGQSYACNTVAIGYQAGSTNQCCNAVAVGALSGKTSQSACAIAVGRSAGYCFQGSGAIAVGRSAGYNSQSGGAIAIGTNAGLTSQGNIAIAIGTCAASGTAQSAQAIAIGYSAGYTSQGVSAVAIGFFSGGQNQSADAVAIGYTAGFNTQGSGAVAIGSGAGSANQGAKSIAIGFNAGSCSQHANSIILNATSCSLQSAVASALYVKPIRNATGPFTLKYDPSTGEITYI